MSALLDGDDGADDDESSYSQSGYESNDAEEDNEDILAPSDDEDAEVDSDALNKLDSFIDGLGSRKRKAPDIDDSQLSGRKRRLLPERTEAGAEGEFAVPSGAQFSSSFKGIDILLTDVVLLA